MHASSIHRIGSVRAALLLTLLALSLLLAPSALAQSEVSGPGVLDVLISNPNSGETPDGLPLFLWIIDGENLVGSRTGETADGRARFDNLPTAANWAYVVQVEYNGVPFSSDLVQFNSGESLLTLPLNIYDGGASSADIRISRGHWVVNIVSPHSIDVGELYALTNGSDRVFMGDGGDPSHVLAFHLPPNATDISFEDGALGERYVQVGDILYDTLPMPPGQRQIFFRYTLPVTEERVTLTHAIAYATATLNLLAPDLGATVEAPGWTQGEPRQTAGGAYLNFTLNNLAANETPQASLSNLSAATFTATDSAAAPAASANSQVVDAEATPGLSGQPFLPILVALLSLAALGGGLLFALNRYRAQAAAAPRRRQQLQEALIEEMAALDDAYEEGEVGAAAYATERRLLKTRLAALMTGQHA